MLWRMWTHDANYYVKWCNRKESALFLIWWLALAFCVRWTSSFDRHTEPLHTRYAHSSDWLTTTTLLLDSLLNSDSSTPTPPRNRRGRLWRRRCRRRICRTRILRSKSRIPETKKQLTQRRKQHETMPITNGMCCTYKTIWTIDPS